MPILLKENNLKMRSDETVNDESKERMLEIMQQEVDDLEKEVNVLIECCYFYLNKEKLLPKKY